MSWKRKIKKMSKRIKIGRIKSRERKDEKERRGIEIGEDIIGKELIVEGGENEIGERGMIVGRKGSYLRIEDSEEKGSVRESLRINGKIGDKRCILKEIVKKRKINVGKRDEWIK